jgi:hypothetical protein
MKPQHLIHKGSRVFIVLGCTSRSSENICSSRGEALRQKERQDETQFTTKIGGKFRQKERQDETQFTTKIGGKFRQKERQDETQFTTKIGGKFRQKERQDETQFTTKIGGKFSLGPSYFDQSNFASQLHD